MENILIKIQLNVYCKRCYPFAFHTKHGNKAREVDASGTVLQYISIATGGNHISNFGIQKRDF